MSIEILNFYPGSVGVNSTLMFESNTIKSTNSLSSLISSAILTHADFSVYNIGGLVEGSVVVLNSNYY